MENELLESFRESDRISSELTKSIIKLIKDSGIEEVNFGLGLGKTLGSILDEFDYRYDSNYNKVKGIGNLTHNVNKHHRGSVISNEIPNIKMLYDFLVDNKYSEDNKFDIGYGDRYMCYIKKSPGDEYDVIYYENQNIKFIVCVNNDDDIFSHINKSLHIRRVHDRSEDVYYSYPTKFSSESIKLGKFTKIFDNDKVLKYHDSRDHGYLLSYSYLDDVIFTKDTKYVWDELLSALECIPNDYKILYNREEGLRKLNI